MSRRKWTEEQRRAASERAKARWGGQTNTAAAERNAAAEPDDEDDGEDVFGQLIATLNQARNKKSGQKKLLNDIAALVAQLDLKAHPELTEDPVFEGLLDKIGADRAKKAQQEGAPPGTVLYEIDSRTGRPTPVGDVPWKLTDVNRLPDGTKELMTWTPNETVQIFYQGVMCQCIADQTMTTEKAFFDVYMEHKRLQREADQRKAWMFGRTNIAPPESGEAAVSMARVRAFMSAGGEYGGGRYSVGYPGDERFELREIPQSNAEAPAAS